MIAKVFSLRDVIRGLLIERFYCVQKLIALNQVEFAKEMLISIRNCRMKFKYYDTI